MTPQPAPDARFTIHPDAVENALGDEIVILHLGNQTYFGLDPVGAEIWTAIRRGETFGGICRALCESYGVDEATIEADVCAFLDEMAALDLVHPDAR